MYFVPYEKTNQEGRSHLLFWFHIDYRQLWGVHATRISEMRFLNMPQSRLVLRYKDTHFYAKTTSLTKYLAKIKIEYPTVISIFEENEAAFYI